MSDTTTEAVERLAEIYDGWGHPLPAATLRTLVAERDALQAEVERLEAELTASCARAEGQQREAERLRRNDGILNDTIEKIFAEGAKQMARAEQWQAIAGELGDQVESAMRGKFISENGADALAKLQEMKDAK